MGTDGPGLFSGDTALDVRDAYREALADGAGDVAAEAAVLRDFADALADPDDAPDVWLALAYTQSTLGRLSEVVRQQALAVIDGGGDPQRWAEAGARAVRQRTAVLEKVRAQLVGPQPARRKLRRPPRPVSTLVVGQVLGYRARSGRLHLMRVAGIADTRHFVAPVIRYLDYAEPSTPASDALAGIPDREFHPVRWRETEIVVIGSGSRDGPEKHGRRSHLGLELDAFVAPLLPMPVLLLTFAVGSLLQTHDHGGSGGAAWSASDPQRVGAAAFGLAGRVGRKGGKDRLRGRSPERQRLYRYAPACSEYSVA